jgi:hypothetical protein
MNKLTLVTVRYIPAEPRLHSCCCKSKEHFHLQLGRKRPSRQYLLDCVEMFLGPHLITQPQTKEKVQALRISWYQPTSANSLTTISNQFLRPQKLQLPGVSLYASHESSFTVSHGLIGSLEKRHHRKGPPNLSPNLLIRLGLSDICFTDVRRFVGKALVSLQPYFYSLPLNGVQLL